MNQIYSELEANLSDSQTDINFDRQRSQAQPRSSDGSSARQQQNWIIEIDGITPWEFSTRFNVIMFVFSFMKTAACATILILAQCPIDTKVAWVVLNSVLELIRTLLYLGRIINVNRLERVLINISQSIELSNHNEGPDRPLRGETIISEYYSNMAVRVIERFSKIRRGIEILNGYVTIRSKNFIPFLENYSLNPYSLWAILLISGLFVIGIVTNEPHESPIINISLLTMILLGVIWLAIPFLLKSCICICRPVILFAILCLFGRPKTIPAPEVDITSLEVTEYSLDLPGDNECIICRVEYQSKDKIIQLKCSPMHYFHEECGKKWLRMSGQCPICRAPINQNHSDPN